MRPLPLLLLPVAALGAPDTVRSLRLGWWDAPASIPGPTLAIESDSDHRGFSPQVMNFTTEARVVGDVARLVVKQVSKDPRTGKDVVEWLPFGNVALPAGEETVGVALVTDASGKRGAGRAFALGSASFPLGAIRLVNLTDRELLLGLGGKGVRVPAGASATHPKVFAKPEVAEITVMAGVNGQAAPVFSTKSEFSGLFRLMVFVTETPGATPPRYEVRTAMDYPQPETKPAAKDAPGAPQPGPGTGGSKPGR